MNPKNSKQGQQTDQFEDSNYSESSQNSPFAENLDPKIPISKIQTDYFSETEQAPQVDISETEETTNFFDQNQPVQESPQEEINDFNAESETKTEPNFSEINQKISTLEVTNQTLIIENQDLQNRLVRQFADMQNLQKQHDLDVAQARKSTKKYIAEAVLSFLNTIYLAFNHIPSEGGESIQKFVNPLQVGFDQTISSLKNQNVEIILPTIGDPYDPETMNALNVSESAEEPRVSRIVSLGLKIDDQLITASQVML